MRCVILLLLGSLSAFGAGPALPELPESAELALAEDWSGGVIDPDRWYALRKQWGGGNNGVVPENVRLVPDSVDGREVKVLECAARGDLYKGPVKGRGGRATRVGGVLVSKQHFASGRFEVTMKIGSREDPRPPGIVPAIWTYGFRFERVPASVAGSFSEAKPLYHPRLQKWGKGLAFYWSELDFPEYGKGGDYSRPMYNTFLNKQHHSQTFAVGDAADGGWHTYTTEWRTSLVPIEGVTDAQVVEAEGFHWVRDKAVPFGLYQGNPLRRLGLDRYAVCAGRSARHWIDGRYIGENTKFVPSMAAQLNLGVWLPDWAGPAPWETKSVRFGSIKVWQFGDEGDVKGVLRDDIPDSFTKDGRPIPKGG